MDFTITRGRRWYLNELVENLKVNNVVIKKFDKNALIIKTRSCEVKGYSINSNNYKGLRADTYVGFDNEPVTGVRISSKHLLDYILDEEEKYNKN